MRILTAHKLCKSTGHNSCTLFYFLRPKMQEEGQFSWLVWDRVSAERTGETWRNSLPLSLECSFHRLSLVLTAPSQTPLLGPLALPEYWCSWLLLLTRREWVIFICFYWWEILEKNYKKSNVQQETGWKEHGASTQWTATWLINMMLQNCIYWPWKPCAVPRVKCPTIWFPDTSSEQASQE